ncbi:biogenesis of lysosome- organelles complex 1 subunit [Branchiostoma belcheri]|nr:biogenesis of lysosome- organelles complex 1 subunit [Branchiostoma belcheri]
MAAEGIVKDVGEIHARLLDHRPVVQGEIKCFIREFEGKRNHREEERLESVLNHAQQMGHTIPACTRLMEDNLAQVTANLRVATSMCEKISETEEKLAKADPLKERRGERQKEWDAFMSDQYGLSAEVDREHEILSDKIREQHRLKEELLKEGQVSMP